MKAILHSASCVAVLAILPGVTAQRVDPPVIFYVIFSGLYNLRGGLAGLTPPQMLAISEVNVTILRTTVYF